MRVICSFGDISQVSSRSDVCWVLGPVSITNLYLEFMLGQLGSCTVVALEQIWYFIKKWKLS